MPKKNIWLRDKQSSSRPAGTTHTQYQYTDLYQISTLISSKFPAIRSPLLLAGSAKSDGDSVCTHKKKKKTQKSTSHICYSALAVQRHWSSTSRWPGELILKGRDLGPGGQDHKPYKKAVLISWLQKENRKKNKENRCVPGWTKWCVYIHTHHLMVWWLDGGEAAFGLQQEEWNEIKRKSQDKH